MTDTNAVTIAAPAVRKHEPTPSKLYELRTLEGSPNQNVNVPLPSTHSVATFAAYRGVPFMTPEGGIVGRLDRGARQRLTESEVEDVKRWIAENLVLAGHAPNAGFYRADTIKPWDRRPFESAGKYLAIREVSDGEVVAEQDTRVVNALGETVGG